MYGARKIEDALPFYFIQALSRLHPKLLTSELKSRVESEVR